MLCRLEQLLHQINKETNHNPGKIMIFVARKLRVVAVNRFLNAVGFTSDGLHGDIKQEDRTAILNNFRSGKLNILVATDVAGRGLGNFIWVLNELLAFLTNIS